MRRLPWGVYLALWSFGLVLALSWLPLWHYPYFTRRAGEYDGVTLWSVLEYLTFDFKEKLPWARECLTVNVGRTLLFLALGAGCGAAVRWGRQWVAGRRSQR